MMFDRILRRENHEWLRQREGNALDRHLEFVHCLEQSALRLWRRAVDLVGEHNVGKNRSRLEFEFVEFRVVNGNSQNIRGKKITRELNAMELARKRPRQR